MERSDMRRVVEKITSLPTLPGIITRITHMLEHPNTTAADVGREIAKDQGLSAKVLQLVNPGFYGSPQPITTIPHAMVLLGFNVVKTLVLTTSVLDIMSQSMAGLWEPSLACARTCGIIAKRLDLADPEEVSVIGLLHDLGKVVMGQNLKEEFAQIVAMVRREDVLFYEAENRILGVTHASIGGWLLDKWQLPSQIVEPIAYHHAFLPSRSNAERTAVVHIADILVRAEGFGLGGDRKIPVISPDALGLLELSVEDLGEIMDAVNDQLSDVMRM